MLIYIIDSNVTYRGALRRQLQDVAEIAEYDHVIAAIDAASERRPDLVISAVNLVGPNAFAFLHEFNSYADLIDIPIILLVDDELGDVSKYGVRAVLDRRKFTPAELRAEVQKWI